MSHPPADQIKNHHTRKLKKPKEQNILALKSTVDQESSPALGIPDSLFFCWVFILIYIYFKEFEFSQLTCGASMQLFPSLNTDARDGLVLTINHPLLPSKHFISHLLLTHILTHSSLSLSSSAYIWSFRVI